MTEDNIAAHVEYKSLMPFAEPDDDMMASAMMMPSMRGKVADFVAEDVLDGLFDVSFIMPFSGFRLAIMKFGPNDCLDHGAPPAVELSWVMMDAFCLLVEHRILTGMRLVWESNAPAGLRRPG